MVVQRIPNRKRQGWLVTPSMAQPAIVQPCLIPGAAMDLASIVSFGGVASLVAIKDPYPTESSVALVEQGGLG